MINGSREFELEEIKRITSEVFALIDSERERESDSLSTEREEFLTICKRAEIKCKALDRRAIENYLSEKAIKKVKGKSFSALGHYDKLNAISPTWPKKDNWRIAREMDLKELEDTDLGEFLDSL